MPQKAVLILGMHRSGTSAMAGVLHTLGYSFGSDLLPPAPDNPKGFFEHLEIGALDEQILFENQTTWDDPRPISVAVPPKAFNTVMSILDREFSRYPYWALKDPRISLFSRIFVSALEARSVKTSVILMIRDPRNVAASLLKRDGMSEPEAANLWLKYTLWPLHALVNSPPIVVFYDRLMDDAGEVVRIARLLDAPMMERAFTVQFALASELRHHRRPASIEGSASQSAAMRSAVAVYEQLLRVGGDLNKLPDRFDNLIGGVDTEQAYALYAPRRMATIFKLGVHFFQSCDRQAKSGLN